MGVKHYEATEVRNFWCASSELRQAVAENETEYIIDYHLDEIETIARHTEQDKLRRRCHAVLAKHRPARFGTA